MTGGFNFNLEGLGQLGAFIPMILILVVFWFILIRPQKKKEKELRNQISALRVGDEIATIGGIHGKIAKIKDDVFVIESGIGTTKSFLTVERGAIGRVLKVNSSSFVDDDDALAALPDEPIEERPDENKKSDNTSKKNKKKKPTIDL